MFLPLEQKPNWRNPPLITLILVIANVLIFFMWQVNDDKYEGYASDYYQRSGLDMLELQRYIQYKKNISANIIESRSTYIQMRQDGAFQKKLENDEIITPDDPVYAEWRANKDEYHVLLNRSVKTKYALNSSEPSLLTYFTSLFIHEDNAHLIGNIVMLILLGLGIEILIGRLLFLLGYLISGLAGNYLFVIIHSDSLSYGIGASGAIAGILGMAIMIYGFRKISFFYFLFVYFDFIKARAVWILPLYFLSQAIIYFVFDSNINVEAHLGGLIGGLLFAGLLKFIPGGIVSNNADASTVNAKFENDFAKGQQLLASMKIDEAKDVFSSLEKQYPDNIKIQQQLFTIAKYNPASDDYHRYAHKLLMFPGTDSNTTRVVYETYQHYANNAKPKPRWTPDLLASIAIKLASGGNIEDAEKIANLLVNSVKEFKKNAEVLLTIAVNYKNVDEEKRANYLNMLLENYPDSEEAKGIQEA